MRPSVNRQLLRFFVTSLRASGRPLRYAAQPTSWKWP